MKMEWTAEILRGWPADGARERLELVKQGSTLVNGDIVEMQADGTVDKSSATASNKVGLVIRGNGDSNSALNSNGVFMTPQPAKTVTSMTWSGGVVTVTVAGHGYVTGNSVTIAGVTPTGYNGTYTVTKVDADNFTFALASNPGSVTVQGTAQLQTASNNSGKALVLWGNYIVKTSSYTAGSYAPGTLVTAKSGKFAVAAAASQLTSGNYTYTPAEPAVGHVLRVQGVTATETAHLVIACF